MPNDARSAACAETSGPRLQRVAQALDVPVEAFYGSAPFDPVTAGAAELLRIWHTIRDPQTREDLLLAARGFADREADACLAAE
ncbi:hypothetical protein [Methylobacterium pseudosasicola]|uniref:Uncharacterized protein n=1 Tax=Methylobacterium pseudosasicola TaxID=582667 RepID=A0A1I4Q132_9HYPH|nr:hypothetical protein [Methylobacterium pseudosasicola]SFM33781.1 hypothetical protein SAMN05192568_102778 [Methylobacterium pseudosasicola]